MQHYPSNPVPFVQVLSSNLMAILHETTEPAALLLMLPKCVFFQRGCHHKPMRTSVTMYRTNLCINGSLRPHIWKHITCISLHRKGHSNMHICVVSVPSRIGTMSTSWITTLNNFTGRPQASICLLLHRTW